MLNMPLSFFDTPAVSTPASQIETTATRVVVLTTLTAMESWSEPWIELDRHADAQLTYFQSYDWCRTWLTHHGQDVTPYVLLVLAGSELLAVWPLMQRSVAGGLRELCALGDPHTQYSNILTRDGTLTDAAKVELQRALADASVADLLSLNYVPEQSPLRQVLALSDEVAILRNSAAHFCLTQFATSKAYQDKESKSQRRMRKKAKSLLTGLGEVQLHVMRPHMPQFSSMVESCIAMKKLWLQRTGRIGMGLTHAAHEAFLSDLSGDTLNGDGAILFVLMAGQKPVAMEYGLLQRGHYYSYLGSFAWGWRHASPGALQIAMTIDWLIDNGVQTFDLLGNPENYKQAWTDVTVPLVSYSKTFTWRGAIYGTVWTRCSRPAIKSLYRSLPASWRSNLNIVRQLNFSPMF